MIILPGPASRELGERIAEGLDTVPRPVDYRVFPDGESYIKIFPDLKGETVVIVQTTAPSQDQRLIQLFMMVRTVKELGAARVICVVPYLAYSRQDKRFLDGETCSLDLVIKMMSDLGVDDLIVADAHSKASLDRANSEYMIRVHNISGVPLLAEYLKDNRFDGAYSLSPDEGAIHLAQAADVVLGGGYGFFEKVRDLRTGEIEMKVKDLDISGRKAVVFDDIISSGGTMARAIEGLKSQGAEKVAAACTHALFMGKAGDRIREAGADIVVFTDSVETSTEGVSITIAPLVVRELNKLIL
ncbi:ribose-phosphate diphosphokinase [Candidatus Bathyarchaeota archaeon]|nr:ribose-phosphate diphosphokinase [Candidatus Bathyarchaeota archaeon]